MKLNSHNLSSGYFWTASMGNLYPIDINPVLPVDRMTKLTTSFVRCSPLVAPAFANIDQYTHHWYVPTWLLWDDFEDFITGNNSNLRQPQVRYYHEVCVKGTLWDYFGLPVNTSFSDTWRVDMKFDALPFKAFWFIYDVFYRDEDLQPDYSYDIMEPLIDKWIAEEATIDELKKILTIPTVSWRKDIYTTARPWQQKGSEVVIPLDIAANGNVNFIPANSDGKPWETTPSPLYGAASQGSGSGFNACFSNSPNWSSANSQAQYHSGLQVSGLTINKLALASAMARLKYRDSRRGSRYVELLQRMGANPADARIFLPQYLGGGKGRVQIAEVVQTSQNTDTSNLGDLGGHGILKNKTAVVRRAFNEHGYQMTLSFFRPETMYQNLTDRWWLNEIREDYFFKELENTGLQEIRTCELYPQAKPDEIFGWNDAYYYYRQKLGKVVGNFRDLEAHWHVARYFKDKPVLNSSFIECRPSNRIFADLANDQFNVETAHIMKVKRIVSKSARLKL